MARRRKRRTRRKRVYYYTRRRRPMARRRYTRAKRYYRKATGGNMKPMFDGFLAGAGGQIASGWIGGYGYPIADLGVGFFMNNATLKVIGARSLGQMIAGQFFGGGGIGGGFISQV